jgi:hypothetical protein
MTRYLDELSQQRADNATAAIPRRPICPRKDGALAEALLPRDAKLELRSAVVCTFRWTRVGHGAFAFVLRGSRPLPRSGLTQLNTDFSRDATLVDPDYDVGDRLQAISGLTAWNDHVYLQLLNGVLVRSASPAEPEAHSVGWRLAQPMLEELFGR